MSSILKGVLFVICFTAFAKAYTQTPTEILSKEEAFKQMLESNFDIQLATNQIEIAENNSSILNSNYLPTVFGLAGANIDRTSSTNDFNGALNEQGNPRPNIVIDGAETTRYDASINASYTLFDGLGRYYNFKQLKERYNLSQLEARETIENVTLQLFSVYFEVARLEENLQVLQSALSISRKRELRAKYQFEYGQVNKLQILNAQVDIVTDSINILNASQQLRNAQRDLNVVLAQDIQDLKLVDTTVTFISPLVMESYLNQVDNNNVVLLQLDKDILITDYEIQKAKGLFLPSIGLNGSYGWNLANNPASAFFPSTTRSSTSLIGGASLRWNIFDGGRSIIGLKNAKIALDNQELTRSRIKQSIKRDVANALGNYTNALNIYYLQEENVKTSKSNFERSEERFKVGQITSVEFRQAQLNLLNVQTSKNAAKYTAKLAELSLLQLTGQLLNVDF